MNKDIILTQEHLNPRYKDIPFDEINLHMFISLSMNDMQTANTIIYRYMIDNPDIPYITKVLKQRHNLIISKSRRGQNTYLVDIETEFIL